jgi:hypothetical protein
MEGAGVSNGCENWGKCCNIQQNIEPQDLACKAGTPAGGPNCPIPQKDQIEPEMLRRIAVSLPDPELTFTWGSRGVTKNIRKRRGQQASLGLPGLKE